MKTYYSKFKFTNGLFYKRLEVATIEQFADKFIIIVFPYLEYTGTYNILASSLRQSGETYYETDRGYIVAVSRNNKKVKIFSPMDMSGIILKS